MNTESPPFAGTFGFGAAEIRVLGCLLEKQLTTPDMYPLTLNSLRLACNQSTNRDPVVEYDDAVLRDALHRLERRGFARLASGRGSRAPKYRHLLAEALPLTPDEHAILCVLMLRGAQTPGELKQRAERMHAFAGLDAVHETLERLAARDLVARLERRPGQKEDRYTQLLQDGEAPDGSGSSGLDSGASAPARAATSSDWASASGRPHRAEDWTSAAADLGPARPQASLAPPSELLAAFPGLQARVARLEREVAELRMALPALRSDAEGGALPARSSTEPAADDRPTRDW